MRSSAVLSVLAFVVFASASEAYITTTTEVGGLCWFDSTAPPSTQTQAAHTATITEPSTLTVTDTKYVYYTGPARRYPPQKRGTPTTIVVSDVCASTTTLVLTPTATSYVETSTTTTTVSEFTTTLTPTYTLCAPGNECA